MEERERSPEELSHEDEAEVKRKADESRRQLDAVPPPGTDPLHEGP